NPVYSWPAPPQDGGNYSPLASSGLSLLSSSGGTTSLVAWPPTACSGSPCADPAHSDNMFGFSDNCWADASTNTTLATAIGSETWAGSVFYQRFHGPIPDQATLTQQLVNSTTHSDNNRTGQSTFYVLYQAQPPWSDSACNFSSGNTTVDVSSY